MLHEGGGTPLAQTLDEVSTFLRRFIIMSQEQADACALFCAMTHVTRAFDYLPYLAITSGTKQSGKTNLRTLLSWFSARPWIISATPSTSVLFRKIQATEPAIFIDECDRIFESDRNGDLYAILNAGNRRGETVPRIETRGNEHRVVDFSIYCAKVLTGIGKRWPDTIVDRCINVRLRRKLPSEEAERLRHRIVRPQAEPLHNALAHWANTDGAVEWLANPENWPEPPEELSDRAQDGWEPLLAIAELVDWGWPERAWNAALTLREDIDLSDSDEMRLLADTRVVAYKLALQPKMRSSLLVTELRNLPESPWGDLDQTRLAEMLRAFEVKPKTVRIDGNPNHRGYELGELQDAWARYLDDDDGRASPNTPEAATPATPATPEEEW
jgi:hypothetical protein